MRIIPVIFIIFFSMFMGTTALYADEGCKDEIRGRANLEPSVTEEEGKLLRRVIDVSQNSVDEAISMIEKNILPDSSAPLYFALGTLYYSKSDLEKAEDYFKQALSKEEHFLRAKGSLARVLIQQNKFDEALELFKDVLLLGQPRASTLTMVGYAYLMKEQPIPAENAYRQAILLENHDDNAYMGLAKSFVMQKRYRESIALIRQLLQSKPYKKELWLMLVNMYLSLGEQDNAISVLESARRLNIADNEALATLGDLYINKELLKDALSVYKKAFNDRRADVSRVLRAADGFIINLDTAGAKEMFTFIKQYGLDEDKLSESDKETFLFLQARCAQIDKDMSKASQVYKELLDMNPMNSQVLMACGDLYREQDELERALLYYERAQRAGVKGATALLRQAQVEVERDRYKQAVAILEEAQRIDPKPFVSRYLTQVRRFVR